LQFAICDCRAFRHKTLRQYSHPSRLFDRLRALKEQAKKAINKSPAEKSGAAMKRMEKLLLDSKKHLQSIMTLYLSDFTPCLIYYKYNNFISYNYF
jgi:hypothetical protein